MKPVVLVVMGVTGCGKSTIGRLLADALHCPFHDGDDYHPPENVEKMSRGIALTDADRLPWLQRLAALAATCVENNTPAVIACSALRQHYRALICGSHGSAVRIIHLTGSKECIAARLSARRGHFMDPRLLDSQFEALEDPEGALAVDVSGTPEGIVRKILQELL